MLFNPCCCDTCYGLTRCDDPDTKIYTRTDLHSYIGHTISLVEYDGFTWGVFRPSSCSDLDFEDVTVDVDVSSELCYCFKLTNCFDAEDVIYSRSPELFAYLDFLIVIGDPTDPDGPYSVSLATEEECTDPVDVVIIDAVHSTCDVDCNLWLALFGSCIDVEMPSGWHAFQVDGEYEDGTILESCATEACGFEEVSLLPCGDSGPVPPDTGAYHPALTIETDPCIQFSQGGPFTLIGDGCNYGYGDILDCILWASTYPEDYNNCAFGEPTDFVNPVRLIYRFISITLVKNPLNDKWHWHGVVTFFSFFKANCGSSPDCCAGLTLRVERRSIFNSPEYTPTEIYDTWTATPIGSVAWSVPRDTVLDPDIDETFNNRFPCYGNFDEDLEIIKHARCAPKPAGCYRHLIIDCTCGDLIEVDNVEPAAGPVVTISGRCFEVLSISFIEENPEECEDIFSTVFDSCDDCNPPRFNCSDCCAGGIEFFFTYLIITLGVVAEVPGHAGFATFLNTRFFNRIYNLPPSSDCASDTFSEPTAFYDDSADGDLYTGFWHTEVRWQLTLNPDTHKCQFEIFVDLIGSGYGTVTGIYLSADLDPGIDCTGFTAPSPITLTRASGDNIGSLDSVVIIPRGYNCGDGL